MAIATGGAVSNDVLTGFVLKEMLMVFKEERNVYF